MLADGLNKGGLARSTLQKAMGRCLWVLLHEFASTRDLASVAISPHDRQSSARNNKCLLCSMLGAATPWLLVSGPLSTLFSLYLCSYSLSASVCVRGEVSHKTARFVVTLGCLCERVPARGRKPKLKLGGHLARQAPLLEVANRTHAAARQRIEERDGGFVGEELLCSEYAEVAL